MTIEVSTQQLKAIVKTAMAAKPDTSYMQVLHRVAQNLGYKSFEALSAVSDKVTNQEFTSSWWKAQDLGFLVYALANNESFFWQDFRSKRPYRLLASDAFSLDTFIQWLFGIDRLLSDEGLYGDLFAIESPPFGFEAVGDISDFENVYSAELAGLKVVDENKKTYLLFDDRGLDTSIVESANPYCICLSDLVMAQDELVAATLALLPELTSYKRKCEAWARICFSDDADAKRTVKITPDNPKVVEVIYQLTGLKLDDSFDWSGLPSKIKFIIAEAS